MNLYKDFHYIGHLHTQIADFLPYLNHIGSVDTARFIGAAGYLIYIRCCVGYEAQGFPDFGHIQPEDIPRKRHFTEIGFLITHARVPHTLS